MNCIFINKITIPRLEEKIKKIKKSDDKPKELPYGQLRQEAELEGAIFSYKVTPEDPSQGAVMAMVGGRSFEKSEFNRATQVMETGWFNL